jgi:hypothetical protein
MVDAAFLERCQPRYLAAVVKVAVEQEPGIGNIDHPRAALLQVGGCSTIRHFGSGKKTARSKASRQQTHATDRSLRFSFTLLTKDAASGVRCFLLLAVC